MELTDGVYALSVTIDRNGSETTFTPAAVADGEGGVVLVDTGLPGHVDELEAGLAEHGFGFEDVSLVILTHHDGDHAGCLDTVRTLTGAPAVAHVDEAPYIDGRKFPIKADAESERYPPARVDVEMVDGVRFATAAGPLEVVLTPGHSPGHCSLYLPDENLLLAGDALVVGEADLQGPVPKFTPDMDRALASLGRLADLDVDATLCFHGGYVEEGSERIREIAEGSVAR